MSQDNLSGRWEEYYSTAIEKGLKAALSDLSIESSFDEINDGHIKLNKLMYTAMAERGLHEEMQHSWHRYGGDLGSLVPSTNNVGPTALDEMPETQRPPAPTVEDDETEIWDKSQYCDFFQSIEIGSLESLEDILHAETTELLDEFYTEYSDDIEEWVDLYLINVQIQEFLHLHQSEPIEKFDKEDYRELADTISRFRKELYSHEELSPSEVGRYQVDIGDQNPADLLSEFLDFIEDIYFTLSEQPTDEFNGDLSYPLGMVEDFYHERAWKLVTEFISLNTSHGPNKESLKRGAKYAIEGIMDRYSIRIERIQSECRAAGLLPDTGDDSETSTTEEEAVDRLPTQSEFRRALEGEEV